jgi:CheY-like chemotaxis protein
MKIMLVDEDTSRGKQICDILALLGHTIVQVARWQDLQQELPRLSPDLILLDLMIPAIGLPQDECAGGFTTGAYIYESCIYPLAPEIPFVVYTAAVVNVPGFRKAIEKLGSFKAFRGVCRKGTDIEAVLRQGTSTSPPER